MSQREPCTSAASLHRAPRFEALSRDGVSTRSVVDPREPDGHRRTITYAECSLFTSVDSSTVHSNISKYSCIYCLLIHDFPNACNAIAAT